MTSARNEAGDLGLYRSPRPLDAGLHRHLSVRPNSGFAFAAGLAAVPLGVNEIPLAARHYPIVLPNEPGAPLAVTGLRNGQNLFVSESGQWRAHTYVPAYVRRYPFIFASVKPEQLILCVDEAASCLTQDDGIRLFDDDGQQSEHLRRTVEFVSAFQGYHVAATQFAEALIEAQLVDTVEVNVGLQSGEKLRLDGLRTVRESALDALPDSLVAEWHRRKWLALSYAMLLSQNNWAVLLEYAAEQPLIQG